MRSSPTSPRLSVVTVSKQQARRALRRCRRSISQPPTIRMSERDGDEPAAPARWR